MIWHIEPIDILDIIGTAVLTYYLLLLIRGTRAVPILFGLGLLLLLLGAAHLLHLSLLTAVLQFLLVGTAVTLPIVFQPELRRALEQLGRGGMVARREPKDEPGFEATLGLIAKTAVGLARQRTGALIAIERTTGLREFVESGTRLDARFTEELVLSIFARGAPLHDGAVIVKGSIVEAAGCFLPLSDNVMNTSHLGTRHRAAIGLSEQTDAVVVVVSEQTGAIAVARDGRLSRDFDDEVRLRSVLIANCISPRPRRRVVAKKKNRGEAKDVASV